MKQQEKKESQRHHFWDGKLWVGTETLDRCFQVYRDRTSLRAHPTLPFLALLSFLYIYILLILVGGGILLLIFSLYSQGSGFIYIIENKN